MEAGDVLRVGSLVARPVEAAEQGGAAGAALDVVLLGLAGRGVSYGDFGEAGDGGAAG